MDTLFFHPKIVHIPIALAVLMPMVAGGLTLAWWRGWLPSKVWLVALGLQGILVVSGVAALSTGESDEERVEQVVPESFIEAHEEAAEAFVWGSGVVFGVMLLAQALVRRPSGLALAAAATLGTLVVFGLGYRTGEAGGALVYEHGAAGAFASQSAPSQPNASDYVWDDDDDDDD